MRRAAFVAVVLVQLLAGLIAISVFFLEESERFDSDANTLISTFGVGMAVFGIVLAFLAQRGDRIAWAALWYWPIFFVLHVVALKTYVPDLILGALMVASLIILRPEPSPTRPPMSSA